MMVILMLPLFCIGNAWGYDEENPTGCIGCGNQEQFYGCADIAITEGAIPAKKKPFTLYPFQGVTNPPKNPQPTPSPWPLYPHPVKTLSMIECKGRQKQTYLSHISYH